MDTADDSAGKLVQERIDGDLQRSNDGRIFRLFDHFDEDPSVRIERRRPVVEDANLQGVAVLNLVIEALSSAERPVLIDAERIVNVSGPDVESEGGGI